MYRSALLIPAVIVVFLPLFFGQQSPNPSTPSASSKIPSYAAIPAEAAKQVNPVKSTPESLNRARKWWALDCEMCHGKSGDGKGDIAKEMKLQIADFTDPATLKDRTDGELFYIIKNGHNQMPAEGPRVKTEENGDLVKYVRSLPTKNSATKQ